MLNNATIVIVNSKESKVVHCLRGVFTEEKTKEFLGIDKPMYFLIHGEEINIRRLMLPKCRRSGIPTMIDQEFSYEFNDLSNIISCYELVNEKPNIIELFVYYFKLEEIPMLKEHLSFSNHKIKGIFSSQFLILNHFRKEIKQKSYLLLYIEGDLLFLAGVLKGTLIKSRFINMNEIINNVQEEINKFVKAIYDEYTEIDRLDVYSAAEEQSDFYKDSLSGTTLLCNFNKLKYKGIFEMAQKLLKNRGII